MRTVPLAAGQAPAAQPAAAPRPRTKIQQSVMSSVWTANVQRAFRVSAELRFGTVWINDHLPLCSELPHGGFKQSGFGKDMSAYAIEEFTTLKHVMADTTGQAKKGWHYLAFGDK